MYTIQCIVCRSCLQQGLSFEVVNAVAVIVRRSASMELRTWPVASPTQRRSLFKDSTLVRPSTRHARSIARPVASTGDFETEGDAGKDPGTDAASRRKLEVVTSLLREGYGVGAILTAAAFRGASFASDVLKGFKQGSSVQRRRYIPPKRQEVKKREPSFGERLQQAMDQSIPATMEIKDAESDLTMLRAEMQPEENISQNAEDQDDASEGQNPWTFSEEPESVDPDVSFKESFFMSEPPTEEDKEVTAEGEIREMEEDSTVMDFKELLGILPEEQISSKHISEERMKVSAFFHAADDKVFGPDITAASQPEEDIQLPNTFESQPEEDTQLPDTLESQPEEDVQLPVMSEFKEVTESEPSVADLTTEDVDVLEDLMEEGTSLTPQSEAFENPPAVPDLKLQNNVETFQSPSLEEDVPVKSDEDSSVVMNRAMELLDEINNFEIETGESVDDPQEEGISVPVPEVTTASRAEEEAELRRKMRIESEKRLKAMKVGNEAKYNQRDAPVKVERPTPQEKEQRMSGAPIGGPTQKLKGLDYIKSYAKENNDHVSAETSKESSPFFTPPPILQDPKRTQVTHASSSTSRGYTQWTEVDRLKRVREIGTVLWLGRGGNGGNGDNGGSGGGGGSGENSDDKGWWIQVRFDPCLLFRMGPRSAYR